VRYLRVLAVLATLMPAAVAAQPKSYPDHAVRFVVPFTPGGNADVVARTVAQGLTEQLKQSVIVENRPGANAMIGAQAVARAAPDGYTLLLATAESHAINPHIYKKVNYDAVNDFAAIGVIGHFPFALVVNPGLPVQTLAEFVDYARRNKGKLNFASWGVGSTSQIAFEQFKQITGVDLVHVPFQGAAPAVTAVAAGQVDAFMVPMTVAVPQAKSGRVKLLGVTTAQRVATAPDIPTLTEQGFPVVIGGWHVIVVPKNTPKEIVGQLNAALNAMIAGKEMRETLLKLGIEPANTNPAEAEKMLQSEWQRWGKVARDAAIVAD
jgi:tripartite-type tricarboxylate transporter receptor subunit TctC